MVDVVKSEVGKDQRRKGILCQQPRYCGKQIGYIRSRLFSLIGVVIPPLRLHITTPIRQMGVILRSLLRLNGCALMEPI
jgi:hypothetical protein